MDHQKAKNAVHLFQLKADAATWTDAQIRQAVKALREVLLLRQQRRATAKHLKATQSPDS